MLNKNCECLQQQINYPIIYILLFNSFRMIYKYILCKVNYVEYWASNIIYLHCIVVYKKKKKSDNPEELNSVASKPFQFNWTKLRELTNRFWVLRMNWFCP